MADSSALSERIARVTDVGSNGSNTADASTDAITPQAASHAAPTPRAPMTRAKPTREDRIAQGMLSEREHELVRDAMSRLGTYAQDPTSDEDGAAPDTSSADGADETSPLALAFVGWARVLANDGSRQPRIVALTRHRLALFKKASFTRKGHSRLKLVAN